MTHHYEQQSISELEAGVAAQLKQAGWDDNAQRHEKAAEAYGIRELTQEWETRQ
jgi:hypothetical protein